VEQVHGIAGYVKSKTHHLVQAHILALLRQWIANEPPPPDTPSIHQPALAAQSKLGAWNTLLGRISTQVTQVQDSHFYHDGSKRTGHRWTVALIKQLQDISFAMWQHRNDVRIGEPTRHLQRDELLDANTAIQAEWDIGKQGLLGPDHYLFYSRKRVNDKSLPLKWEWLAHVTTARAAAAADVSAKDTYNHERTGMREWILRHNPAALLIRDGPKTTQKRKTKQKNQKIQKKPTKKSTTRSTKTRTTSTQKRKSTKTSNPTRPSKRRRK
jgi:hypothetical protein